MEKSIVEEMGGYDNLPIEFKIAVLKQKLTETDYKALKFTEGELSAEEFEPIRQQRRAWREEINQLEQQLNV